MLAMIHSLKYVYSLYQNIYVNTQSVFGRLDLSDDIYYLNSTFVLKTISLTLIIFIFCAKKWQIGIGFQWFLCSARIVLVYMMLKVMSTELLLC